jgi:hypothetical protein
MSTQYTSCQLSTPHVNSVHLMSTQFRNVALSQVGVSLRFVSSAFREKGTFICTHGKRADSEVWEQETFT